MSNRDGPPDPENEIAAHLEQVDGDKNTKATNLQARNYPASRLDAIEKAAIQLNAVANWVLAHAAELQAAGLLEHIICELKRAAAVNKEELRALKSGEARK